MPHYRRHFEAIFVDRGSTVLLAGAVLLSSCCALLVAGCDLLKGEEANTRLLLYASPRTVPTDGQHIALIGVEAVEQGGEINPSIPMCARLSAQLGTFDAPKNAGGDGGLGCSGDHCVFLSLASGQVRRDFAVYHSSTVADHDLLLGELYELAAGDPCPPALLPPATASGFLTLDVPDVVLQTQDLSLPETPPDLLDGGTAPQEGGQP